MTAFDPLQRCSSYNQLTNREIITAKHKACLLCIGVLMCVSRWVTKRQKRVRLEGHKVLNIHLSLMKMRIVQSTQRTHLIHPSVFCFSALAVTLGSLVFFFFFSPHLSRKEFQTSEAVAWWSLTLRELCSVTPATQSLKSPNEKTEKKKKNERERGGGAVYDIALQWTPEKRKISINFTRGSKSGWVCRDDFIVQSGRLLWRC